MENEINDENRTRINISIDNSTLAFIDKMAKLHQMSRSGFMIFSSIKYAKEFDRNKEFEKIVDGN